MPVKIKPLTQGQVAGLAGITTRTLQNKFNDGKGPPREANGNISVDSAREWLMVQWGAKADGEPGGAEMYDYQEERARLTKHQADEKELLVAELQGDMVRVSVVEKEWTEAIMSMRAKLLALPVRLASKAVGMDSIREIEDYVREEIYAALFEVQPDYGDDGAEESEGGDQAGDGSIETAAETYGIRMGGEV